MAAQPQYRHGQINFDKLCLENIDVRLSKNLNQNLDSVFKTISKYSKSANIVFLIKLI